MKYILLCLIFGCLAGSLIEIVEGRYVRKTEDHDISSNLVKIKTHDNKLHLSSADIIEGLMTSNGCNENGIKSIVGDWKHCINLTQDFVNLELNLVDWSNYGDVVKSLAKDLYGNLTECKIKRVLNETLCVANAFLNVLPEYEETLTTLIALLQETADTVSEIETDFVECLVHKQNVPAKINQSCDSSFSLIFKFLTDLFVRRH